MKSLNAKNTSQITEWQVYVISVKYDQYIQSKIIIIMWWYKLPGSHWLCCSACWELWKVLILSPQSDPSRRPLPLWEHVGQTSPSGCSKTPWSYWTTWWAERWYSAWTEDDTEQVGWLTKVCFLWYTVINLYLCEKEAAKNGIHLKI